MLRFLSITIFYPKSYSEIRKIGGNLRSKIIPGWSLSLFDESESRRGEFKFDVENALCFFLSGDENNNSPSDMDCFFVRRLISIRGSTKCNFLRCKMYRNVWFVHLTNKIWEPSLFSAYNSDFLISVFPIPVDRIHVRSSWKRILALLFPF